MILNTCKMRFLSLFFLLFFLNKGLQAQDYRASLICSIDTALEGCSYDVLEIPHHFETIRNSG